MTNTVHPNTKAMLNPGHLESVLVYDLGFTWAPQSGSRFVSADGRVVFSWDDREAMAWTLLRLQEPGGCIDGALHMTGRHSVDQVVAVVRGFVHGV